MSKQYANKTCYDCGVKNPANMMQRVEESYNSGRSDNRVTGGNLAFAMVSDTAAKKVKRTIVANNRRSYTRNRTVWKCLDCSGHNAAVQHANYKAMKKQMGHMGMFGKVVSWHFLILFAAGWVNFYEKVERNGISSWMTSDGLQALAFLAVATSIPVYMLFIRPKKLVS